LSLLCFYIFRALIKYAMKKFFYLTFLMILILSSCTYENDESFYNTGNQTDTTTVSYDNSLVANFLFEYNLADSSLNDLKLSFNGTESFNSSGYKGISKGSLILDGNSSFSFFTGIYDTISICFHFKSAKQLKELAGNMAPTIVDFGKGAVKFEVDGITGQTFIALTSGGDRKKFDKEELIVDTWAEWNFVYIQITGGKSSVRYSNKSYGELSFESVEKSIDFKNGSLIIGKSSTEPYNYFKGSIDDLKVFNRALSEEEIKSLK